MLQIAYLVFCILGTALAMLCKFNFQPTQRLLFNY